MPGLLAAAQCVEPCALPKSLPFYFGLVIVGAWLVGLVGLLLIARYLLLARLSRRPRRESDRRALGATFAGRDIEPW